MGVKKCNIRLKRENICYATLINQSDQNFKFTMPRKKRPTVVPEMNKALKLIDQGFINLYNM